MSLKNASIFCGPRNMPSMSSSGPKNSRSLGDSKTKLVTGGSWCVKKKFPSGSTQNSNFLSKLKKKANKQKLSPECAIKKVLNKQG